MINNIIIHIEQSLKYISVFKEHKNTSELFIGMKTGGWSVVWGKSLKSGANLLQLIDMED